jgi:hypothetical protein
MLEEERRNDPACGPPLLYLHTDMRAREWALSRSVDAGMQIVSDTEISLIDQIRKSLSGVSNRVYSFEANEDTGKVFLVELQVETNSSSSTEAIQVPILFFSVENLTFLVRALLNHKIRVHTLVHINDGGGSKGGSQIPMNFIYQVAGPLELQRVVCDADLKNKKFDTKYASQLLQESLMPSHEYDRGMRSPKIEEVSAKQIHNHWKCTCIPKGQIPANSCSPDGVKYFDWRLK